MIRPEILEQERCSARGSARQERTRKRKQLDTVLGLFLIMVGNKLGTNVTSDYGTLLVINDLRQGSVRPWLELSHEV